MKRLVIFAIVVAATIPVRAAEKDAKVLAQHVLDQGSALFDSRDAAAMAATYSEDAKLLLFTENHATGEIKVSVKNRAEIESLYHDLFKDNKEKMTSKNSVEFARLVTPELMVIHGAFQPNAEKKRSFPFVQTRVKHGDKWLMKVLQLYVLGEGREQ